MKALIKYKILIGLALYVLIPLGLEAEKMFRDSHVYLAIMGIGFAFAGISFGSSFLLSGVFDYGLEKIKGV